MTQIEPVRGGRPPRLLVALALLLPALAPGALAAQRAAAAGTPPLLSGERVAHREGPVFFDLEFLGFRRDSARLAGRVVLNVDGGRLRPEVDGKGFHYAVGFRWSMTGPRGRDRVRELRRSLVCSGRLGSSDGIPLVAVVEAPPGRYVFEARVADLNRGPDVGSRLRGALLVPTPGAPGVELSPLAVVSDTLAGGPERTSHEASLDDLVLNAAHVVDPSAAPGIYFETYGLRPGDRYRTELRLEPAERRGALDRLLRGGSRAQTFVYEGSVAAEEAGGLRTTLQLDLREAAPGRYRAVVGVRDLTTGAVSLRRSTSLRVLDPHRSSFGSVRCR